MKNKKQNSNEFIVNDQVYYDSKVDENGRIRYCSVAEQSSLFKHLLTLAGTSANADKYKLAANRFLKLNEIYVWLLDMNYIDDPKYDISWNEFSNMASFSVDFEAMISDFPQIEDILRAAYEPKGYKDVLDIIFTNLKIEYRCPICGAYSFLSTTASEKNICNICNQYGESFNKQVSKEFQHNGSKAAIDKRNQLIKEGLRIRLPKSVNIQELINDYIAKNSTPYYTDQIKVIKELLEKNKLSDYKVFCVAFIGIVLMDCSAMNDIDVFSESVGMNKDNTAIVTLYDSSAVHIDKNAVRFALNNLNPFKNVDIKILNEIL